MKETIQIAIQDANILIDLLTIKLFDHCLSLNYTFVTTDLILDELDKDQLLLISPYIQAGTFRIFPTNTNTLIKLEELSHTNNKLSIQDWSAFYFAQQHKALLMTGDKRLRIIACHHDIEVCGILRILDELFHTSVISKAEACKFIKDLTRINRRLPAEECGIRATNWCD